MTEPPTATMSQDVFDRNWSTIAAEVKAILAARGKTRRRFRTVAVYAKDSGELVAEVLQTSCGPVVVYRGGWAAHVTVRHNPDAELPEQIIGMRQGRGALKLDVQPFTGSEQQFFQVTTRRPIPGIDGHKFHHVAFTAQHIIARDSLGGVLAFR